MPVIRKQHLIINRPSPIVLKGASSLRNVTTNSHIPNKNNAPSGSSLVNVILDKKKGQHLLKNPGILDKIVDAANIKPSELVLEIGPGTGNLTMRLLPLAKRVIAFDIDPRMVAEVKKRANSNGYTNLEVKEGDALRSNLGEFDVCTANLPYQISSPFIFKLLAHRPLFRCAVLMFQEEFAQRLLAEPGEKYYCRLTVNTRLLCKVTRVCKVAPGSFNPPPKVNSMVVKFVPNKNSMPIEFSEWDGLMRICFTRKKKTLRANFKSTNTLRTLENNYKTWCSINNKIPQSKMSFKDFILDILNSVELGDRRAFTININEYLKLLLEFNKNGIHFMNIASKESDNYDMLIDDTDTIDSEIESN